MKKNRKITIITFISLIILGAFLIIKNINNYSELILKDIVNSNIKVGNIEIRGLNVNLKDIELIDLDNNKIGHIDNAVVKINPFLPTRLGYIKASGGNIKIVQKKDNHLNIERLFPANKVVNRISQLNYMYLENIDVKYINETFETLIEKDVKNVRGVINTHLENEFFINVKGETEKKSEKIAIQLSNIPIITKLWSMFSFKNDKAAKKSHIKLKLENFELTKELAQFIPLDMIKVNSAMVDGVLEIKGDKSYGNIKAKKANLFYKDYPDEIINATANIKLNGDKSFVSMNALIEGEKIGIDIKYNDKNKDLNVSFNTDEIEASKLLKYKLFRDFNLNISGKVLTKLNISLDLSKDDINVKDMNLKFKSDKLVYDKYDIKDIDVNLKNKVLNLKLKALEQELLAKVNLDISEKKGEGDIVLKNGYSPLKIDEIKSKIKINSFDDIELISNTNDILFKLILKNNKINLNFKNEKEIDYTKDKLSLSTKLEIKDFEYDLKEKSFNGEIVTNSYTKYNRDRIFFNLNSKLNKSEIKSIGTISTLNQELNIEGLTSLEDLKHDYSIKGDVDILNLIKLVNNEFSSSKDDYAPVYINANIYGEKNNINSKYLIASNDLNYFANILGLKVEGEIENILNDRKINARFNIPELWFKYHRLKDISGEIALENNILHFNNIRNKNLSADFSYNLSNKFIDLKSNLKDYVVYSEKPFDINLFIKDMNIDINGKTDDLNAKINLKPSVVRIDDEHFGILDTNINVKSNIAQIYSKINNNNLSGTYNIKTRDLDLNLILDEKLGKILHIEDLDANIKSKLRLHGKPDDLYSEFVAKISNINYKGYKIPNASIEGEYIGGDIYNIKHTGILNIENLVLTNSKNVKILETPLLIDFEFLNLNYRLDNKIIDLSEFGDDFSGKIKLNAKLIAKDNKIYSELDVKSDEIVINKNKITNLIFNGQLTDDGININQGYLEYENNPILIEGFALFNTNNYILRAVAEDFNLEFLKVNKGVQDSKGIANLDFTATKGKFKGNINIKDFGIKTKEYDIRNFNVNIDTSERAINVKNISGDINNGKLNIFGKIQLPKTINKRDINVGQFDLNIKTNRIRIPYEGNDITVSSDLKFLERELAGNIVLNNTKINSLSFIDNFQKTNTKVNPIQEKLKKIAKEVLNKYSANINLNIEKPVKIDVPNYSVVKNIIGELQGQAQIRYNNSKVNLLGSFDVSDGKFEFNGNTFNLETLKVRFDGIKPNDPYINLKAITNIQDDSIELVMNSRLSEKDLELKSNSNKTRDELLSLLAFKNIKINATSARTIGANVLNIATETAINQFISSITNKIGKKIGLEKLEVNANILDKDKLVLKDIISNSSIGIVAKGKLYKGLYWNAKTDIPLNNASKFKYDVSASYNVSEGLDVNVGVKSKSYVSSAKDVNFYTGVNYSKKFNNYSEIGDKFNNIFEKREKIEGEKNEK